MSKFHSHVKVIIYLKCYILTIEIVFGLNFLSKHSSEFLKSVKNITFFEVVFLSSYEIVYAVLLQSHLYPEILLGASFPHPYEHIYHRNGGWVVSTPTSYTRSAGGRIYWLKFLLLEANSMITPWNWRRRFVTDHLKSINRYHLSYSSLYNIGSWVDVTK